MSDWQASPPPPLREGTVHVWRLRPGAIETEADWSVLSLAEQERAARFYFDRHRTFYVATHAIVRRILAGYLGAEPSALQYSIGARGKPAVTGLEFNLSHSGEIALLAIARRSVGVDVEHWDDAADYHGLAEHFFSPAEQEQLRALAEQPDDVRAGFFAAWSRKEAYLKASGVGIAEGLDHFAMSLTPGAAAELLHDIRDVGARDRWFVAALDVGPGYSAALVAEQPVHSVLLFDLYA